jgi:hypothetical protein
VANLAASSAKVTETLGTGQVSVPAKLHLVSELFPRQAHLRSLFQVEQRNLRPQSTLNHDLN